MDVTYYETRQVLYNIQTDVKHIRHCTSLDSNVFNLIFFMRTDKHFLTGVCDVLCKHK